MMKILTTELTAGAAAPFTFLHLSDTHLTRVDPADGVGREALAAERSRWFFAEDGLALGKKIADEEHLLTVHTGDLMDFWSPANARAVREYTGRGDVLFTAGNHEIHTCPHDRFCEEDFTADLGRREEQLDRVQAVAGNDIRFFCREVNGVKLVGISDADYQVTEKQFEQLRAVVCEGKPVLLFLHIPPYHEELGAIRGKDLLATPKAIVDTYSPFMIFEQQATETTYGFRDYIMTEPLIKAVFCGHIHFDYESSDKKVIVTGLDTLRKVTVK